MYLRLVYCFSYIAQGPLESYLTFNFQIIWAMICREYLGILDLFCTASGVLYIHKIDFQRKTLCLPHPSPFSPFFVPSTPLRSFPKLLFHESRLSVLSAYTVILILCKPPLCSYIRPFPNYHSATLTRSTFRYP